MAIQNIVVGYPELVFVAKNFLKSLNSENILTINDLESKLGSEIDIPNTKDDFTIRPSLVGPSGNKKYDYVLTYRGVGGVPIQFKLDNSNEEGLSILSVLKCNSFINTYEQDIKMGLDNSRNAFYKKLLQSEDKTLEIIRLELRAIANGEYFLK